ncbi:hypothetical protein ES703_58348 [subsurface metagenome]
MSDKLTDLQVKILRTLREHKKKDTYKIFSMDTFYKTLPVEVEESRFREDLEILERHRYIVIVARMFGEKFPNYEITAKGIEYLRHLEEDLRKQ